MRRLQCRVLVIRIWLRMAEWCEQIRWLWTTLASACRFIALSLATPDDIAALVQQFYTRPQPRAFWGERFIQEGLLPEESAFVTQYLQPGSRCLVLYAGGGREVLALSQRGFQVLGLEASPVLADSARRQAVARHLRCEMQVVDVLDPPKDMGRFDAVFLTQYMYSAIPTCRQRIALLRHIGGWLNSQGYAYLEFCQGRQLTGWQFRVLQRLARLTRGYRELSPGDTYQGDHFWHRFSEPSELWREVAEAGLRVVECDFNKQYAVLTPADRHARREN